MTDLQEALNKAFNKKMNERGYTFLYTDYEKNKIFLETPKGTKCRQSLSDSLRFISLEDLK